MGKTDEAIAYYFKIKSEPTEKMKEGLAIDKVITDEIINNKKLPDFIGGKKLINPLPQLKIEISYNKYFDLVGVLDCYDAGTIYEFKTGNTNSYSYIKSNQIKLYTLLAKQAGYKVEELIVVRYSQKENDFDWSKTFYNDTLIEEAKNLIDTIGGEIYINFINKGLL